MELTNITSNDKVSSFVDVYNENNKTLTSEINELNKRANVLDNMYSNTVKRDIINSLIYNEVVRILDTDYKSENNENSLVRKVEVRTLVNDILSDILTSKVESVLQNDLSEKTQQIKDTLNNLSQQIEQIKSEYDESSILVLKELCEHVERRCDNAVIELSEKITNLENELSEIKNEILTEINIEQVKSDITTQINDIDKKYSEEIDTLKKLIDEHL